MKMLLRPLLLFWLPIAAVSAQTAPVLAPAPAPADATITLEQAVDQVHRDTGGTVLSAEPRHVGRRVEYRIKVLTPQGHVKVIAVPADTVKPPALTSTQSTKNPVGNITGNKEKH